MEKQWKQWIRTFDPLITSYEYDNVLLNSYRFHISRDLLTFLLNFVVRGLVGYKENGGYAVIWYIEWFKS